MKAQELRIGNFVEILTTTRDTMIPLPTGKYGEINRVSLDKVQIKYVFETNTEKHVVFNRSYNTIKPIPLTEEWLVKFGFYKRYGSYIWIKILAGDDTDYPITLQFTNNHTAMQICRSGIGTQCAPCSYVHQLQNLYFALTGEELTIKRNS